MRPAGPGLGSLAVGHSPFVSHWYVVIFNVCRLLALKLQKVEKSPRCNVACEVVGFAMQGDFGLIVRTCMGCISECAFSTCLT